MSVKGMLGLTDSRVAVRWLLVAATASLAAALVFEYAVGLAPCVLCLWQRWPFVAVVGMASAALAVGAGPGGRTAVLGLCGTAFLIGAGIAAYHVGVEQHWWVGTSGCGVAEAARATTAAALLDQIMAAPVVRCDEVAWSLFGVSLAGYNGLLSLILVAYCAIAAWSARRPAECRAGVHLAARQPELQTGS